MQPLSGLSWGVSAWGTPQLKGKAGWTERGRGTGHTVEHTAGASGKRIRLTMGSLEEEQCREKGRNLGGLERNKGGKTQL